MFKIENDSQFRLGYEMLATITKNDMNNTAMICNAIPALKRELRRYSHRDMASQYVMGWPIYHNIIKEYGIDGYVELVAIPKEFKEKADAEEFFRDFIYVESRPSMYDCTGKPFTSWYKLFKRHEQFYAYHRISYDV